MLLYLHYNCLTSSCKVVFDEHWSGKDLQNKEHYYFNNFFVNRIDSFLKQKLVRRSLLNIYSNIITKSENNVILNDVFYQKFYKLVDTSVNKFTWIFWKLIEHLKINWNTVNENKEINSIKYIFFQSLHLIFRYFKMKQILWLIGTWQFIYKYFIWIWIYLTLFFFKYFLRTSISKFDCDF